MTEREKAEFERRKNEAERQLNEMYYGKGPRSTSNNGIKMPSFLAPNSPASSKNRHYPEDKHKPSEASAPRNEKTDKSHQPPKSENRSVGRNLLNMLNFKGMNMDNDRLVILAVCLLLSGEDADELLMLALIYIML